MGFQLDLFHAAAGLQGAKEDFDGPTRGVMVQQQRILERDREGS